MSTKRFRPEEIIAKLREADALLSQGTPVAGVVKALGVSDEVLADIRTNF